MISIYHLKSIRLILMYLLVCSILIDGCASVVPLIPGDKFELTQLDGEDVTLILPDYTRIESRSYLHVSVESPSDFVYGIGYNRYDPSHDFRGRLLISSIDSCKNVTIKGQVIESGGKSLLCWLKDGRTLIFRERNYLRITPADSIGFFYIGTSGTQNKTPLTNIKFEVKEVNIGPTILVTVTICLFLVYLFLFRK